MNHNNINFNEFRQIISPNIAYYLGFLWADGHVSKIWNSVIIDIIQDDFLTLKKLFDTIGQYKSYITKRKKRKTKQSMILTHKKLKEFLVENDFNIKSVASPAKIMNKIPEFLWHYFVRAWFDGDGCMYYSKNKTSRVTMGGSFLQDWSMLENILKKLKINYYIYRIKRERGNSSSLVISEKESILKFFNYIYPNKYDFGLYRKYNKFILFRKKVIYNLIHMTLNCPYDKTRNTFDCTVYIDKKPTRINKFKNKNDAIAKKIQIMRQFNTGHFRLMKLIGLKNFNI